jgi:hypothetical protein
MNLKVNFSQHLKINSQCMEMSWHTVMEQMVQPFAGGCIEWP